MALDNSTRQQVDGSAFSTDDLDAANTLYYNVSGAGVTADVHLVAIKVKDA
jgi:hypothetical protein